MSAITATRPMPRLTIVPMVSGALTGSAWAGPPPSCASTGVVKRAAVKVANSVLMLFLQPLDTFARTDHIGQADTKLLIHHHNLAVGDQRTVNKNIQRLTGQPVEFDH